MARTPIPRPSRKPKLFPAPFPGIYESVIDNFESGDMTEYTAIMSLQSDEFSASQTTPFEGSWHGLMEPTGSIAQQQHGVVSEPGDGLANYPKQGDTFEMWVRAANSANAGILFAFNAADVNGYVCRFDGSTAYIERIDSASRTTLTSASISNSVNTWYRLEVSWTTSGDITFDIYNESGNSVSANLPITANDTTYGNNGYGAFTTTPAAGDNTLQFDAARITG